MPLSQVREASFFLPWREGQGVVVFRGEMGRPAAFNGFVCLVGEAWNLYMGKEGGQGGREGGRASWQKRESVPCHWGLRGATVLTILANANRCPFVLLHLVSLKNAYLYLNFAPFYK
jgi:hypothetical protein